MSSGEFPEKLTYLLQEFERSSLREVHIRRGDIEIYLSRNAGPHGASRGQRVAGDGPSVVASAPLPKAPPSAVTVSPVDGFDSGAALPPGAELVLAPNIGTFYRSPKPGAEPYVQIGDAIAEGDELCLIEVMKLFTAVKSPAHGKIHAILVEDGAMVSADQPLFVVVQG